MSQTITITQLDVTATEWIQQEAQRTGTSVEAVVRQLIYRGLARERQQTRQHRHHDLDALAGTWSAEEAAEFRSAIADLNQVDAPLWQ